MNVDVDVDVDVFSIKGTSHGLSAMYRVLGSM